MVALPEICFVATELDSLMREGRRREARALATTKLRDGYSSRLFLAAVATIIDDMDEPRGKGRRPVDDQPYWSEIGSDFEALRDEGATAGEAKAVIMGRRNMTQRSVERALTYYRRAVEEDRRIRSEEAE